MPSRLTPSGAGSGCPVGPAASPRARRSATSETPRSTMRRWTAICPNPQSSTVPASRSASVVSSTKWRRERRPSVVPPVRRRIVSLIHSGRSGGLSTTVRGTPDIVPRRCAQCSGNTPIWAYVEDRQGGLNDEVANDGDARGKDRALEEADGRVHGRAREPRVQGSEERLHDPGPPEARDRRPQSTAPPPPGHPRPRLQS